MDLLLFCLFSYLLQLPLLLFFLIYGLSVISNFLFFKNEFHVGIQRIIFLILFVYFLVFEFSLFVLVVLFNFNYTLENDNEIYYVIHLFFVYH